MWPSGRGKVSSEFESQHARLSPPRCLTCLLGLQGVQWVRGLVVVRVSWPGHPGLKKKKRTAMNTCHLFLHKKKQLECNNYEMRSGQLAQRSEWLSTNKKMQTKMGWSNILKRKGKCREAGPRNAWCIQVWNVGNTCSACFCALQMGPPCSYEHPWLFL